MIKENIIAIVIGVTISVLSSTIITLITEDIKIKNEFNYAYFNALTRINIENNLTKLACIASELDTIKNELNRINFNSIIFFKYIKRKIKNIDLIQSYIIDYTSGFDGNYANMAKAIYKIKVKELKL